MCGPIPSMYRLSPKRIGKHWTDGAISLQGRSMTILFAIAAIALVPAAIVFAVGKFYTLKRIWRGRKQAYMDGLEMSAHIDTLELAAARVAQKPQPRRDK